MKKLIAGIALLSAQTISGQNFAINTFLDTFDLGNTVPRCAIARTTNGTLFQIPYTTPNFSPQTVNVIVSDSVLNVHQSGSYEINNYTNLFPTSFFGLGAYRVLAVSNGLYNNSLASIFATIDTSGQIESAYYTHELDAASFTADGGYIAFGRDSNKVIRFDSLSNVVWQYRFDPPPGFTFLLYDVIEYSVTGEITLTGRLKNTVFTDSIFTAVVRLDSDGNLLWAKRYTTRYNNAPLTSFKLNQVHYNGELFLRAGTYSETVILCLDAQGNVQWYNSYYQNNCSIGAIANSFFEGYGGVIYLETVYLCNMSGNMTVMCIDKSNGNLIWTKSAFGLEAFSDDQYGPDIRYGSGYKTFGKVNDAISLQCIDNSPTVNNLFAMYALPYSVGESFTRANVTLNRPVIPYTNLGPASLSIVHVPSCSNITNVIPVENNDVITTVNAGMLHVDQTGQVGSRYTSCKVLDIHGRSVCSEDLDRETTDVRLQCAPGVYLVVLVTDSGISLTRKVLISE